MNFSQRHLLLLLGTVLLVQNALGIALPLDETTTYEHETDVTTLKPDIIRWDEAETPSDKLLFYVLNGFSKVFDSTLSIGTKLLDNVIAEISAMDDKSEKTIEKLEEFSDVAMGIRALRTEFVGDSFDFSLNLQLITDLKDLLELSNITIIEEPTEADKLFAKVLENNDLSNLEEHFKQKFSEIVSEEFYATAKNILNSATAEEWPEKENIQEWLEKLNAEKDINKKLELFNHFYEFYE